MTDSELIWFFLDTTVKDDHPAVYLYCCGHNGSYQTSVSRLYGETKPVFCPPMDDHLVATVVKAFLENKKKLYMKGLVKVTPIYGR